ncbi:MAG: glycosyltransferase family 2 protein [Parachlamydiaceae bacterium]
MKCISIITPCYNEEENVEPLSLKVKEIFALLPNYDYEHIFIDNSSEDQTVEILKHLAQRDQRIKMIVNHRNFGQVRSPFYGMLQSSGDATILLVADFQDPPEMIIDFLKEWEKGWKVVAGVKAKTNEPFLIRHVRRLYYALVTTISEVKLIKHFTGFALYDRTVVDAFREMNPPFPYLRGLISEIGCPIKLIPYEQPARREGVTKNHFFSLYDVAMLGMTTHSKIPIRLATIFGFLLSTISLFVAFLFVLCKLIFSEEVINGLNPMLIALFFFSSVQLFFIGVLGEYICAIQTQVTKRPLVYEKERINF